MENFQLTITGSLAEQSALEKFGRQYGVAARCEVISVYEGIAVTTIVLQVSAPFDTLCKFIAAYQGTRSSPPTVSYSRFGKDQLIVNDHSPDGIAKVLRETEELHFEEDLEPAAA